MTHSKYYKAATTDLVGPLAHHTSPGLYLPGTEHVPDWLDMDASKSCTHGLYVTSRRRVAARWGCVVLEVQVLGNLVKTLERVKPSAQPHGVAAGKYNKYRTDRLHVVRIVGVTGYKHGGGEVGAGNDYARNVIKLNKTLQGAGMMPVTPTFVSLEVLRSEDFQLFEVRDPNPYSDQYMTRHGHRFEIDFDADHEVDEGELYLALGKIGFVKPGSQRARRL